MSLAAGIADYGATPISGSVSAISEASNPQLRLDILPNSMLRF
jgi:hypothetical protein